MTASKKILILDDEPDLISSVRRILRLEGFVVESANSFAEAKTQVDWLNLFAILLDRKLPDGMSEEFLPEIRQLAPQAGIIVITAYADLESSLVALRHGAEDYLLKPVDPEALRHRLRSILDFRDAEQRAIQAERLAAIGQMVSVLSHESRNFIQRIVASVDTARLDLSDTALVSAELASIERSAHGLHALLEEVRNYAAPITLQKNVTNLRDIWRSVWADVLKRHPGRTAHLVESESAANDVSCECDEFRMQQVFRNLFENSLAACQDPVQVKLQCESTNGLAPPALQVIVQDNGPGLSPEQRARAFDAFYTTKVKGSGLGLPIVRRIMEAHGGHVAISPNSPSGATFVLTLPQANSHFSQEELT